MDIQEKSDKLTYRFGKSIVGGMFKEGYDMTVRHGKGGGCIVEFRKDDDNYLVQYGKSDAVWATMVEAAYELIFGGNEDNL